MKKFLKVLKVILIIILVIILAVVAFFGVLTVTEFKPAPEEAVEIKGNESRAVLEGDELKILTWNIGYGALDKNADFFMDGGTHVSTASESDVYNNLDYIANTLDELGCDIMMFQEVDTDSKRSHNINEELSIFDGLKGYQESFAVNYRTLYVPYPIPPIGKVDCGIMTTSVYKINDATRVSLPCPFKYPVRLGNLKRCLLVTRIPVENSDKELVVVNLHLEAYDDGEGKAKQTAQLRELLEQEALAGNYVIAGGDFNQSFSNVDVSMYPVVDEKLWAAGRVEVSEFPDNLSFHADNTTPTCRSLDKAYEGADKENFQYYMIDGFIVSSNVEALDVTTIDTGFEATDHNPVVMTVKLN